jgi:branched-chain amino acid transport system permease protein
MEWQFFIELVTNGVLTGLMYSLVAVGFVLIFKSTDALNFAQGEFCMIAAIIIASLAYLYGVPLFLSILIALAFMLFVGMAMERMVLRRMIGQPVHSVIMATLGLALAFRGLGPLVFGAETRPINLPIDQAPIIWGPFFVSPIDLLGATIAIVFLAVFGWFFMKSRKGVATSSATSPSPGCWRASLPCSVAWSGATPSASTRSLQHSASRCSRW